MPEPWRSLTQCIAGAHARPVLRVVRSAARASRRRPICACGKCFEGFARLPHRSRRRLAEQHAAVKCATQNPTVLRLAVHQWRRIRFLGEAAQILVGMHICPTPLRIAPADFARAGLPPPHPAAPHRQPSLWRGLWGPRAARCRCTGASSGCTVAFFRPSCARSATPTSSEPVPPKRDPTGHATWGPATLSIRCWQLAGSLPRPHL